MSGTNPRYRIDATGEFLEIDEIVERVRAGSIDLGRRIGDSSGWKAPLEEHPALVDRLLRDPGAIGAPEFRQRFETGQCLHCHRKDAAIYERRRVAGLAVWTRERAGLDLACPGCRARAIRSDLFSTAWLGFWGLPAAIRSARAAGHGLRAMTGRGDWRGLASGLTGLLLLLTPLLAAGLVGLLFLVPQDGELSRRERAAREADEGSAHLGRREYDAAIARLEEAARLDPEWEVPRFLLARAWFETGEYARALESIREAERLAAAGDAGGEILRTIRLWHARTARRAGEPAEAIEAYRKLLAGAPGDLDLRREYQDARIEAGERAALEAEERARIEEKGAAASADDHYLLGRAIPDAAGALEAFDRALAVEADHAPSLLESAARLDDLGRWEEAIARARAAREGQDSPRTWAIEGFALAALGRRQAAVEALERGVEAFPRDIHLRRRLADAHLWTEHPDRIDRARRAIEAARRFAAGDPYLSALLDFDRANVAREAGAFDEALAGYRRVREAKGVPDSLAAEAWLEAVLTLVEAGRLDDAAGEGEAARPFLEGDPTATARLDLWLGIALVEQDRVEDARERWRAAPGVPDDPRHDPTPAESIRFLLEGGSEEAYRERTRVVAIPTLANNVDFVAGVARLLAGDRAGAGEAFERSAAGSWGRNFPYYSARRWAERMAR